jgi:hypothetical protein
MKAFWFSMTAVIVTCLALLVAGSFVLTRWDAPFRVNTAIWDIEGRCWDERTGNSVVGANVTATFAEPLSSRSDRRAEYVDAVETDRDGRFELKGSGASVAIIVEADGYVEEVWGRRSTEFITDATVHLFLGLQRAERE